MQIFYLTDTCARSCVPARARLCAYRGVRSRQNAPASKQARAKTILRQNTPASKQV